MAKKAKKSKKSDDLKAGKKKGRTVSVDGTKMEGGGGRIRLKEGDYPVKVVKSELGESQAGNTMITLTYEFTKEAGSKAQGKTIKDRFALTENALWRLRNFLEAIGKEPPKKVFKLNIDGLVGEELAVTLEDEEYENKMYSKVSDYISMDDFNSDEEDEDEDEDEDDEDESDEDDDDEDEDDEDEDDDDEDEDLDEVDLDDEL